MNTVVATPPPAAGEDLRIALWLGAGGAVSVVLLMPYLLATMPQAMAQAKLPFGLLVLVQALQGFVLIGLMAYAGLRMGHGVGLGAPWIRALVMRRQRSPQAWGMAVVVGLLSAVAIVALAPVFDQAMPAPLHPLPASTPASASWAGLLASFYGGIAEEVQLRLFLMTALAWGLCVLLRRRRAPWVFWLAIALAALAFGAGHLPAAAKVWPLDAVVVARTLVLNGLAGVAFGWLYWRQGIESAMLAHFCGDLVLHVATPLLSGQA